MPKALIRMCLCAYWSEFLLFANLPKTGLFLVSKPIYIYSLCMLAAMALVSMCICTGLSEPSLLDKALSTKILRDGPFI